jgi:hypothetical protein
VFGLDQFVDQRRRGGEANAALLAACGYRKSGEQMGFPGPAITDEEIGSARAM